MQISDVYFGLGDPIGEDGTVLRSREYLCLSVFIPNICGSFLFGRRMVDAGRRPVGPELSSIRLGTSGPHRYL